MGIESDLALTGFQGPGVIEFTIAVRTDNIFAATSLKIVFLLVGIDIMVINIFCTTL